MGEGRETDPGEQSSWWDRARPLTDWGRVHPTTLITVTLAAVVVLRVAWAAGFETATALALVSSLSVTQMLSGVAVVILPTVLVLLGVYVVVHLVDGIWTGVERKRPASAVSAGFLLLAVLAISARALSLVSLILLVVVGSLVALMKNREAYKRSYLTVAIVIGLCVCVTNDDVWLPAEHLVTADQQGLTGYVLNDDSGWQGRASDGGPASIGVDCFACDLHRAGRKRERLAD